MPRGKANPVEDNEHQDSDQEGGPLDGSTTQEDESQTPFPTIEDEDVQVDTGQLDLEPGETEVSELNNPANNPAATDTVPVTITEVVQKNGEVVTQERQTLQNVSKMDEVVVLAGRSRQEKLFALKTLIAEGNLDQLVLLEAVEELLNTRD